MTAAGGIALVIAVFGAFSYAAASILQAIAARRSVGTVRTMAHPLYLIGIGCDMLAWFGSMIALRELAVYLVESVLAGSLALTVVGARLFLASPLRKRDAAAVMVTLAALTVLALSAGPQADVTASNGLRFLFCGAAVGVVLIGYGATKIGAPGGAVAALAGLSLGGAALVGRALPMPAEADAAGTALAIVTEPLTAALVTFAATGMMLYAYALQHGEVGPVTAVHWAAEVITPSAIAVAFLGDTVRAGWALPATVAGLVTVAAAVLLATAPATRAAAHPTETGPAELPAAARPAELPAADVPAGLAAALQAGHPAIALPAGSELPAGRSAALPARIRAAAPAAALPAAVPAGLSAAAVPGDARPGERIIWWGPRPIWRPPDRPKAALTAQPVPELTWKPPHRARSPWTDPPPARADRVEVLTTTSPAPPRRPEVPREAVPATRPWYDL
jgi:hypothetical protein